MDGRVLGVAVCCLLGAYRGSVVGSISSAVIFVVWLLCQKATCLFPSEFVTTLQWCFQCGPKLNLKWRLKKAASAVNDSDKEPRTGFVQGPWFGT